MIDLVELFPDAHQLTMRFKRQDDHSEYTITVDRNGAESLKRLIERYLERFV